MTNRTVTKALIAQEDFALGQGSISQTRQGVAIVATEIDLPWVVTTLTEVRRLDTTKYNHCILDNGTTVNLYRYNAASAETIDNYNYIAPNEGIGQWERVTGWGQSLDGTMVTDNGVQREIQVALSYRPVMAESFATLMLMDLSGYTCADTASFYVGLGKGNARYFPDGTTANGTTTFASTAYADNSGFYDANGDGFRQVFTGAVDVASFGAKGDASTDDTTAINSAVAWIKANQYGGTIGQATLYFPPVDSSQYYLISDEILFYEMIQVTITGGQGAHIRNNTTDAAIFHFEGSVGFGNVFGFVVDNVFLQQNYASNTNGTIKLTKCILSWFDKIYIDNNDCGYGIYADSSSSENFFNNMIIENAGTDGMYINSDLNHFGNVHIVSAGRYGAHFDSSARGNVTDGIITYLSGQHGIYCVGQNNQFDNVVLRNNGQDAANTYDGAYVGGTYNTIGDCQSYDDQGSPTQRYGVNLQGTGNKALSSLTGTGNVTGLINNGGTNSRFHGDGVTLGQYDGFVHNGPIVHKNSATFSDGDTTPSVSGGNKFRTSNSSPTSITTFDDGTNGQTVRVLVQDANTTFVHSASFNLGGSNIVSSADDWLEFEQVGTTWYGWSLN